MSGGAFHKKVPRSLTRVNDQSQFYGRLIDLVAGVGYWAVCRGIIVKRQRLGMMRSLYGAKVWKSVLFVGVKGGSGLCGFSDSYSRLAGERTAR